MARVQLFLSSVSAEFLSYRERLRHLLTRPDVEVKVQEDFIVTGDETLEMLDAYIQGCDGVIHLVGDMTGAMAMPQSVEAIAKRYPDLASRFPIAEFLQGDGPSLSYTQWEAWLALLHGKRLYIAKPEAGAPRDEKYVSEAGQQALQQAHLSRLRGVARYPGGAFTSQEDLALGVYRSFVLDLLVAAGLSPIRPTPHNLPERTTSAERFVGRAQELAQLGSLLAPDASRVYLTGMGGVGKSELAIQLAYDSLDVYRGGILRLDARQGLEAMAQQVITFFRGVFPEVALPDDRSPMELLAVCWSQWPASASPPEPVLLILDDQRGDREGYGAERQLLEGLPGRFRRLITQREAAPTGAQAMDLPLLKREASLELLALQAGEDGPGRLQAAHALCSEVGDLPLALVLLGARLAERPDLRLEQLLADLQAKGVEARALLKAHPELGARLGVVESLLISWEPLSAQAKELAVLLGMMAPALIPWDLVEACRREDQELEEGSAFGEAQAELLKAQLLDRVAAGRYQLHPLVRGFVVVQARGMESVRQSWRSQLARAVAAICRDRFAQVMTLERQADVAVYVPHVAKVADYDADALSDGDLVWPFIGLARLVEDQANFSAALAWSERCLEHCEKRVGTHHPDTAASLNNLAKLLLATNQLEEAEPLMRRALAIDEANYGPDHPEVATNLNNLAQLLKTTNQLEEAEPLMRRVLAIDGANYGPEAPDVAIDLNNLARLLQDTNRLSEAEPLMRRALAIDEASYGPDHPKVAIRLNNLAILLQDTNRMEEAEPLLRRALAINEASYGPDHPIVSIFLNNLARLLQDNKRQEEAEPLFRRALAIAEKSYGPNHPDVAIGLNNLARLLQDTNRVADAESLSIRAARILLCSWGSNHPFTQKAIDNYLRILQALGLHEAEIDAKLDALQAIG
jgi:tetratricopeptide (TPR) repeat protein